MRSKGVAAVVCATAAADGKKQFDPLRRYMDDAGPEIRWESADGEMYVLARCAGMALAGAPFDTQELPSIACHRPSHYHLADSGIGLRAVRRTSSGTAGRRAGNSVFGGP
ncbi:hypothetical protein F5Y03DRAFT_394766 [Xylaria venustula]|nr:hypothetical protein F5Y03DRAFT_394766 [Xylaria venustula]